MSVNGFVEHLSRQEVTGWAYDPAAPERPAQVTLWLDGREVAASAADRERADLRVLNLGRTNLGFRLPLPQGRSIDRARMMVRLAGVQAPLPVNEAAGAFEGMLETIEPGRIAGWAWHAGYPEERVTLLVKSGDKTLGRVTAAALRADLRDNGVGDGAHAFEVLLSADARDIDVVIEATGQPLPSYSTRAPARPVEQPAPPPVARASRPVPPPRSAPPPRPSATPPLPAVAAPRPPLPAAAPAPAAAQPSLSPELIEAMRAALRLDDDGF